MHRVKIDIPRAHRSHACSRISILNGLVLCVGKSPAPQGNEIGEYPYTRSTDKKRTIFQKGHAKKLRDLCNHKTYTDTGRGLDLASAPLAKGIRISPTAHVSVRVVDSVAARHRVQSGYS